MRKPVARIVLKVSYVVAAGLFALSLLDRFVWKGRYAAVPIVGNVLLFVLVSMLVLTPDRDAHRMVPSPENRESRTVLRWRPNP